MEKKLLIGAGLCCAWVAGMAAAARKRRAQTHGSKWDKMQKRMEQMPEDFPPRVMYNNLETTRANTEEILKILRGSDSQSDRTEADPPS